jgi:hypothetical protein
MQVLAKAKELKVTADTAAANMGNYSRTNKKSR